VSRGPGSAGGEALPAFGRRFFDATAPLTRMGRGAIGGKASGLVLARDRIVGRVDGQRFPSIPVTVPSMVVLASDLFESFVEHNDLGRLAASDEPDDRIAHAFQRGSIPPLWVGDLRALATQVRSPLAVRSSSRLEDDLDHPFAGVYATKMIPNNQEDPDARFRRLVEAVKYVWASTWFRGSRDYLEAVGHNVRDESMAVIVQEIVGTRAGDRFYPAVSGVARSFDYYPAPGRDARDGVVSLALGLGKTIVDGGVCWSYGPTRPKAPPPFADPRDRLRHTQTRFWGVNMGRPPLPDPIRETEYLVEDGLERAERDGVLAALASTYDPGSDRFYPGLAPTGPRVLDFAPLLSGSLGPVNDLVRHLLDLSRDAMESDVEIELAISLARGREPAPRLGFLQVRPMKVAAGDVALDEEALSGEHVIVSSHRVMGHGSTEEVRDVVYLDPDAFDASSTRSMVAEIEARNRALASEGRPYLLVGFGRWGSADPWLGVPVQWSQISGARAIVEATRPDMNPEPSQGSHFFHNMIGLGVLYMSVPHWSDDRLDWPALGAMEEVHRGRWVRHVRTDPALRVVVDGRGGRGIVVRDG